MSRHAMSAPFVLTWLLLVGHGHASCDQTGAPPPATPAEAVRPNSSACPIVEWQPGFQGHVLVDMRNAAARQRAPLPGVPHWDFSQIADRVPAASSLLLIGNGFDDADLRSRCQTHLAVGLPAAILRGGARVWNRHVPFAADAILATVDPAQALAQLRRAGTLVVTGDDELAKVQAALPATKFHVVSTVNSTDQKPRFHTGSDSNARDADGYLIAGGTAALLAQGALAGSCASSSHHAADTALLLAMRRA